MPPPQYNPADMSPSSRGAGGGASGAANNTGGGGAGTGTGTGTGEPPAYASITESSPPTSKSKSTPPAPPNQPPPPLPQLASKNSTSALNNNTADALPLKSESSGTIISVRQRHESGGAGSQKKLKPVEAACPLPSFNHNNDESITKSKLDANDPDDPLEIVCVDNVNVNDDEITRIIVDEKK